MKISLKWLKRYIDISESPEELGELLTNVGLECEAIEDQAETLKGFVVGEVLSCEKHPEADKLSLCFVDNGKQRQTVVCGAPNVAAGQKVVLAQPGAVLPSSGITIETRAIRGTTSAGMICSGAELGINDDHSGILILEPTASVGTPLGTYLGSDDVCLDIGITPNRGDALSYIGIARDIGAVKQRSVIIPDVQTDKGIQADAVSLRHEALELCPRYSVAIIKGVTVGPSPPWLQNLLRSSGVRPINNVVDVTNFVMLEIGQPMHAFDMGKVDNHTVVIREAVGGEHFTTLDGTEHTIPDGTLLICDQYAPIALAGVMGGLNSEITEATKDVLLESAYFNPSSIRRTAKSLGISTDSSHRFERSTDIESTVWALQRAIDLMLQCSGGRYCGIIDSYPSKVEPKVIPLRLDRIRSILGIEIDVNVIEQILHSLGISVGRLNDTLECRLPSHRSDLQREIDLIEEVARIHGYDRIPVPERTEIYASGSKDDDAYQSFIRSIAISLGLDEVISPSLISKEYVKNFHRGDIIEVLNPISIEATVLRPTLILPMLRVVDHNLRNGVKSFRAFEIGTVFRAEVGQQEQTNLVVCLAGLAERRTWYARERSFDFHDLKGLVESLLAGMHLDNTISFQYDAHETLGNTRLSIEIEGKTVGYITQIPEQMLRSFHIESNVYCAELSVDMLSVLSSKKARYTPVAKYPVVYRDLAFWVDTEVTAQQISETIEQAGAQNLDSHMILDIFQPKDSGSKKSIAVNLVFVPTDHTLTDAEIHSGVEAVASALSQAVHAIVRR